MYFFKSISNSIFCPKTGGRKMSPPVFMKIKKEDSGNYAGQPHLDAEEDDGAANPGNH